MKQIQTIILLLLVTLVFGCHKSTKDTEQDASVEKDAAASDGDVDSDSNEDAGSDANEDAGSDTDAGQECGEHIVGNRCVENLTCYCIEEQQDCFKLETYDKAHEWTYEQDGYGGLPCLFRCYNGGAILSTSVGDSGGEKYFYSNTTEELVGIKISNDYPAYCNETYVTKHIGVTSSCVVMCKIGDYCSVGYPYCDDV